MKTHARAAVIGGGIMGCAMLYELTRHGWRDVVLIEKGEITSGSTWHAAGQVPYYADTPFFARMQSDSFEGYKRLEVETGMPTGVHAVGSLRLARTKDEVREYKRYLSFARGLGIKGELIGANETRALWPLLEFRGFEAALHTFADGYTDPNQTTNAFAKAARDAGAEIYRHTRVTGLARTPSGEWRVETDKGAITVDVVVNAAGFWGSEISQLIGHKLPVLAMEHEYLVTEPIPAVAELSQEMPILRDMNVPTYVRQERQALLVACYEDHPVFWGLDGIPRDFGQELLPPDVERAAPNLEKTFEMVPALKSAGIKTVVNGPTGRSADLKPLVGPAHGERGYYTLCGVVGGFLQSSLARHLAEWIIEGEPSIDLSPVDVRRFGGYATQAYAVARVSAGHAYSSPVYYPHAVSSRGRPARTSPLYATLKAKGAVFGVENGWEVPNWFAPPGAESNEGTCYERQTWVAAAAAELQAIREHAVLIDATSRAKIEVEGAGAAAFLDRLSANRLPQREGGFVSSPLLTAKGRVAALSVIERLGDARFYVTSAPACEQRDLDWLHAHRGAEPVSIRNVTGRDGLLWLGGAEASAILAAASGMAIAAEEWSPGQSRTMAIGAARVRVRRVDDVCVPAFEIVHPIEAQYALYHALNEAGAAHGIRDGGMRAYNALRIEAGIPLWGVDVAADCAPAEAGLAHLVAADKGDYIGRDALAHSGPARRRLVRLAIEADGNGAVDPWGSEVVIAEERDVGHVTSGAFAPSLEGSIALARIATEATAKRLEVEILGQRRRAVVVERGR
ncbi:MAG: FAD-dependent oxidoreductase [Alphaproteobacteria bacterium]